MGVKRSHIALASIRIAIPFIILSGALYTQLPKPLPLPAHLASLSIVPHAHLIRNFLVPSSARPPLQLGTRPAWLVSQMQPSALRDKLHACTMDRTLLWRGVSGFSISHRGAPLEYPEHTREGYVTAAAMASGWMECDIAFTKDSHLVCRHSHCDLHTTTDILVTPLAEKCRRKFVGATDTDDASAECCTTDITLEEFRTLRGKMDSAYLRAKTPEEYVKGAPGWRTELHVGGSLMTHRESIELFKSFGAKFVPELKGPKVPMPYNGMSQSDLAQKVVDEYLDAGVDLRDVRLQSKNFADVSYWLKSGTIATPVLLDERFDAQTIAEKPVSEWGGVSFEELYADGLRIIAPPTYMLLKSTADGKIVPSAYATAAKAAGLDIITWTLERSGPLTRRDKNEYYYQTLNQAIDVHGEATAIEMLHVLAQDVGVLGVFSDWPATVSFYAACFRL